MLKQYIKFEIHIIINCEDNQEIHNDNEGNIHVIPPSLVFILLSVFYTLKKDHTCNWLLGIKSIESTQKFQISESFFHVLLFYTLELPYDTEVHENHYSSSRSRESKHRHPKIDGAESVICTESGCKMTCS